MLIDKGNRAVLFTNSIACTINIVQNENTYAFPELDIAANYILLFYFYKYSGRHTVILFVVVSSSFVKYGKGM